MSKDWVGNQNSIYKTIGASNHTEKDRETNDYYTTEPKAIKLLLEMEKFSHYVWECACGEGHLSEVLKAHGYDVKSSDVINRGYENTEIINFLTVSKKDIDTDFPRDIITNPPYKFAKEFIENALQISTDGTKIAMFLKVQFLEGKARRALFDKHPQKVMQRFGADKYDYNWDRFSCWVEFWYKGQLYRFEHSIENAKQHGSDVRYGSDVFAQVVLTLENIARMTERGIYELQTWVAGLKALPKPKDIQDCFKILGFNDIPKIEELKTRYRQIVKTAHPDSGGTEEYFLTIQNAYSQAEQALKERESGD